MGIKDFFDKVGDVGRDAANDVAKNIKNAGDFVGDKTAEAANAVGHGTKNAVGFVVDRAQDVAKGINDTGNALGDKGAEVIKDFDKRLHNPVPLEDIFSYYHGRVKLIRIDRVNEHRNGPAFGDAVGFDTNPTGKLTVLNLYHDQIARTGFKLLPNWDEEYYFKHPCLTDTFISLEHYFEYIKKSRISELERIGYDLGAKHIKIVFKEEKKGDVGIKVKGHDEKEAKINKMVELKDSKKAEFEAEKEEYENVKVEVDIDLDGNATPNEPKLLYFDGDSDIASLIHMRMDPNNILKKKIYNFYHGQSNGMSVKEAISIDSMIKPEGKGGARISAGISFQLQAEKEKKTILEYTIEF